MAYTSAFTFSAVASDGLGGQQSITMGLSTVVPTKPAFPGTGTATTTPAAISLGSVTTPKALIIVNDGAQEITVDTGADTVVLGTANSTTKLNFCLVSKFTSTPEVSTASSTSAYRTFILE